MTQLSRRQLLERAAFALFAIPRAASADDYPSRPIRLVIPYAPGASGDQIGRPWAESMHQLKGVPERWRLWRVED